ncbi:MAG: hypothetical protein HY763_06305 [Planctomycetes bacterium]|nr:hypothetical protein [Planctomycetota bacterium]
MLLDEPVEDCVAHPAEQLLSQAMGMNRSGAQDWLSRLLVETYASRPSLAASILRCVGRLDFGEVGGWGLHVADDALHHSVAEVREAAVRALEAWGDAQGVRILRQHQEKERWLRAYIQQVIVDLSSPAR